MVAFEAAVAGGIPIIKALREGLTANRIQYIAGIINGTTNYILSEMRDKGLDFATALKEAQELGYAEADPTFDIEGVDAAHKATIMSAIAFGMPVQFDKAYVEGISKLQAAIDIKLRRSAGLPHQAAGHHARRTDKGIELRVHPTLMPAKRLLANVEGAMNAVVVQATRSAPRCTTARARAPSRRRRPWSPIWSTSRACIPPTRSIACRIWRSSRTPVEHADPADRRSDEQLLPASARGGRDRRARRISRASSPTRTSRSTRAAEGIGAGRRAQGKGETDIILITHETVERARQRGDHEDRGAADRCVAGDQAAHGSAELGQRLI
jgi:homoserine dehydrogenase